MELRDLKASKAEQVIPSTSEKESNTRVREQSRDFQATFNKWVQQCSNPPDGADGDTFVDEKGILRYVQSWKPVHSHSETSDIRVNLSRTGCIEVPVRKFATGSDASPPRTADLHTLSFLMDFRTQWNHLADDSIDEVAEYSPLFRIYMEVFFHKRTIQLMLLLTAYNVLVQIISSTVYPILDPFQQLEFYLYDVVGTVVYIALAVVFKGSQIFAFAESPAGLNSSSDEVKENRPHKVMQNHTTSCQLYIKEAMRTTIRELQQMWNRTVSPSTSSAQQRHQPVPFYSALNIALKFLSLRKIAGNKRLVLNTRANNLKLMFIFLAVPVYCVLWNFLCSDGMYAYYTILCADGEENTVSCKFFELQLIMTLGSLTMLIQKTIYTSSVLLSLMGLHFGAEVGRGLVDSWINRFGMLRRLEYGEQKVCAAVAEDSVSGVNLPVSSKPAAKDAGTDPVINTMHAPPRAAPAPANIAPEVALSVPMVEVMEYLQRDAYEHYLFIREFMFIGSRAWSPIILTLTVLDIFYVFLFAYNAVTASASGGVLSPVDRAYFMIWIAIRVFLLTVYPIVSLAHANAYVYVLQEQFLMAAPEDFSVLGGRDGWLRYLEKVPAIWTVYGVLITWDRLTGVVWTVVAALGAVAIAYASNNV